MRNILLLILPLYLCACTNQLYSISRENLAAVVTVKVYRQVREEPARSSLREAAPENLQHLLQPVAGYREVLLQRGSGFFVAASGALLTSFHILEKAERIEIQTKDGQSMPAKLVAANIVDDLALLHVDRQTENKRIFPYLKFAAQEKRVVGEKVRCISAKLSSIEQVSVGNVIDNNFAVQELFPEAQGVYLKTSCATSRGFSGGPVLSVEGDVVGMNSHIIAASYQSASRLSLALPQSTLVLFLEENGVFQQSKQ